MLLWLDFFSIFFDSFSFKHHLMGKINIFFILTFQKIHSFQEITEETTTKKFHFISITLHLGNIFFSLFFFLTNMCSICKHIPFGLFSIKKSILCCCFFLLSGVKCSFYNDVCLFQNFF